MPTLCNTRPKLSTRFSTFSRTLTLWSRPRTSGVRCVTARLHFLRPVPARTLPLINGALVSADRAPPHDGIGIRVDIRSDHARTALSPRAPSTPHWFLSRFLPRLRGRINNNLGKVLGELSCRPGLRSNLSLICQKVREVCNPGICHLFQPVRKYLSRCVIKFVEYLHHHSGQGCG
jgi:hypothetical protein